jgi:hypothetical protein
MPAYSHATPPFSLSSGDVGFSFNNEAFPGSAQAGAQLALPSFNCSGRVPTTAFFCHARMHATSRNDRLARGCARRSTSLTLNKEPQSGDGTHRQRKGPQSQQYPQKSAASLKTPLESASYKLYYVNYKIGLRQGGPQSPNQALPAKWSFLHAGSPLTAPPTSSPSCSARFRTE